MNNFKNIHFIGIGGIGISALAYLSLAEGKKVTGSDGTQSALTDDLIEAGAHIAIGHDADSVTDDAELVIYTEAIDKETNPEYLRAKELGIPVLSYFEALGQISRTKKTVAVIGTHGKTTTTAMFGLALIKAGLEPTIIVGSKVKEFGGRNIYIGKGDVLVTEACEYRRSFLSLEPFGLVFLNCEADHLDYYKDEEDYMEAYAELIKKVPADGFMVANMEDKNVEKLSHHCAGKVIPVYEKEAEKLGLKLKVLGYFNKLNAAQAYLAAEALSADADDVRLGLEEFGGTWRRMEVKGEFNGAVLIDDYGHHPTEIKLTLKAIRDRYADKHLICVFQPHQYSRTHLLIEEFKGAFGDADMVIIPNIYEARDSDEDKTKISAEKLVELLSETHPDVRFGGGLDKTYDLLTKTVKPNDVVVTMGAGDIGKLATQLASK